MQTIMEMNSLDRINMESLIENVINLNPKVFEIQVVLIITGLINRIFRIYWGTLDLISNNHPFRLVNDLIFNFGSLFNIKKFVDFPDVSITKNKTSVLLVNSNWKRVRTVINQRNEYDNLWLKI